MRAEAVTIDVAEWDDPDGVALRAEQRIDIDSRYGADTEPGTRPTAADISVFLIARDGVGDALGCGALRQLDDHSAEIKRMYVRDAARGRGISRLILAALEQHALAAGWPVLRLETGPRQHEAIGLYVSSGYQPIPNFGPYIASTQSRCYQRDLGESPKSSSPRY